MSVARRRWRAFGVRQPPPTVAWCREVHTVHLQQQHIFTHGSENLQNGARTRKATVQAVLNLKPTEPCDSNVTWTTAVLQASSQPVYLVGVLVGVGSRKDVEGVVKVGGAGAKQVWRNISPHLPALPGHTHTGTHTH